MKSAAKVTIALMVFAACLFSVQCLSPLFSSSAVDNRSIETRLEIESAGSFTRTHVQNGPSSLTIDHSTGKATLSDPQVMWVISDGGLAYIPAQVELGARGNLAFYGCYLNNKRTRLFSTTTTSSLDAMVWEDTGVYEAFDYIYTDASEDGNTLVALAQFPIEDDVMRREVKVFKYTSDSSSPDWVYTFPLIINAGARVKISRDGSYIAAVVFDNNTNNLEIAFFESGSGTPILTRSYPSTFIRALDMSDDGGLLYINEGPMIHMYNTFEDSMFFHHNAGASFDSHSLSGDGSRFAYGGFNFVKCYEWNGTTYVYQFTYSMSGTVYCARCDLSADAGTLAAAFYNYGNSLDFRVVKIDATSGVPNFEADFSGGGAYQNAPWQIVASDDGSRIVYGGWGDQLNTNPEVMVFEGDPTPVASIDTRGSVFDVDISGDGIFVASGSKSVHANVQGNSGDHACLYMGGQDLYMDGVPSISSTVTFTVEGAEGDRVMLAASLGEVEIETPFGILIVDPERYVVLGTGEISPSGILEIDVTVPGSSSLVGRKVAVQALVNQGKSRHLTNGHVFWVLP